MRKLKVQEDAQPDFLTEDEIEQDVDLILGEEVRLGVLLDLQFP